MFHNTRVFHNHWNKLKTTVILKLLNKVNRIKMQ